MDIKNILIRLNTEFPGIEIIYNYDELELTHIIMILDQKLFESIEFSEFSYNIYTEIQDESEDIIFIESDSILYPSEILKPENYSFEFEDTELIESIANEELEEDSARTISTKMNGPFNLSELTTFISIQGMVNNSIDNISHNSNVENPESGENNYELAA